MSGLKEIGGLPGFAFSGARVTPDEMDTYTQYVIMKPSASASELGTVNGTANAAITISQTQLDYPRNVLASFTCANGGGTVILNGTSQFGEVIQETITITAAANGGTTGGTKVFAHVASGTWYPNVSTAGTLVLGYAIGTANSSKFGLPSKIAATTDVKMVNWIDNGVMKAQGTPSTYADTTNHAWKTTDTIAAADDYIILFRSTYDNGSKGDMANL